MPGVRIQHPTERNVMFTLVDGSRPYTQPYECPACHMVHTFKTYHFRLDDSGAAIISVEIAGHLKKLHGHGFTLTNEVKKPPARIIIPGVHEEIQTVAHPNLREPR